MKILMLGPARDVKGGMTSVVNNYFEYGLSKKITIKYIETINDKNIFLKFFKEIIGFINFICSVAKYDIVHIHMASRRSTNRKCVYVKISHFFKKKVVLHIHGGGFKNFYENECNKKKQDKIIKTINSCEKIIVLSEEWERYFRKILDNKNITIMYNGVYIPNDYKKEYKRNILFLGRINKNKGIYDLLEVFSKVLKKYNDVVLNIGGSGEEEKLKERIERLGIKDNVNFLGWIGPEEKKKQLKNNSIFILPSYFEAMPISILEAMSYKNITIASNVGGIPQIINNGQNGILIEPGDKDAMYNTLVKVLKNPKAYEQIASRGRENIEKKFNISSNIRELIEIYNSILKKE